MTEYCVPTAAGEASFTEKRSEFLGHVRPVESEEEARAFVAEMKKKYYDARHNCWCYIIKDGAERYSDDGEPQGTAGIPMLEVFRREGVCNVVCVVTRYFGGILLGAGGLLRAYTKSAKDALDAAGISVVRRWVETALDCSYAAAEKLKQEITAFGGIVAWKVVSKTSTMGTSITSLHASTQEILPGICKGPRSIFFLHFAMTSSSTTTLHLKSSPLWSTR